MRIVHILPFPEIGGTEIGQVNLMLASRRLGVDAFALVPEGGDAVAGYVRAAGFEAFPYAVPQPSFRHGARFWRESGELAAFLHERKATAMHCANVLGAYHCALAGRRAGIPVIGHVRGRFEELPFREKVFMRWVDRWAFVSRSTWDRFCIPVKEELGDVVYDGVSFAAVPEDAGTGVRAEFGLSGDTVIVGMVARVAPQKDFETLIRSAATLSIRFPAMRFLMVGDLDPLHYPRVRRWLEEHQVADRFLFTGFRRDIARLMKAMDVAVLSTHGEGLPLVLLEAMSHSRPVVATGLDGILEVVEDGRTGLLVPHGDAAALAEAIGRLVSDPALARRLGEAGRRTVETKFSQQAFEQSVERLYAGVFPGMALPGKR